MNNIIRFWNKNRRGIIAMIIIIVLIIVFIQILNQIAKEQKMEKMQNKEKLTQEEKELPTESIITGQKISVDKTKENVSKIKEFVEKCNNKDIDGAYELLTDECKQAMFTTKQQFIDEYYNLIFTEKRICDVENYLNNSTLYTYKVKYYSDSLSTGKISESNYTDYITIDGKSSDNKIKINSYIINKKINKSVEKNGITINVISKDVYMNYEKYNVDIKNGTNKTLLLNTNNKLDTINIITDENVKIGANTTEITDALLKINPYMTRTYNIKFNKIYNPNIDVQAMNFEDIVNDYEKYINTPDEVKERIKIQIDL